MAHTLFVLGAGATRGLALRRSQSVQVVEAALDSDFFECLQFISDGVPEHWDLVSRVVKAARAVSSSGDFPTLESVFTFVEAALEVDDHIELAGQTLSSLKSDLKSAIALQLGSALWDPNVAPENDGHIQCDHHRWLAQQLVPGDTVISFNYDCLVDFCLARCATDKGWSPSFGYGLNESGEVRDSDVWASGSKDPRCEETIKLLKLHGSLNWLDDGEGAYRLIRHPYELGNQPLIIPPEWNKRIGEAPFREIWKSARTAVSQAKCVVFVGYSMPPTDLRTQVLFRAACGDRSDALESLVVVNPDDTVSRRIRTIFGEAVDGGTRIIRRRSWEDLRSVKKSAWYA